MILQSTSESSSSTPTPEPEIIILEPIYNELFPELFEQEEEPVYLTLEDEVTAKIRNLHDYQLRLLHGIMPLPSGTDIANTIKNFSQILLSVLKDVPRSPLEMLKIVDHDSVRLALFPNLDYKGLYNAIVQLMDVAPLIQYGLHTFGQAVLQCLGCLLSFLDAETIEALPYLVASSMAVLPSTLHQEIVNCLCFYILPFTITRRPEGEEEAEKVVSEENYASQSVSAILMMVFQFSANSAHHCQILECLMAMKATVVRDLLCIMAYGTSGARNSAAKLLFYYWPPFNINAIEKRTPTHQVRLAPDWPPLVCQRDMCPNAGIAEAAKVCFDHGVSITFANERPPPLYLCIECANEIHRCQPNLSFHDILHPMQQVSLFCENKSCRSTEKQAVSVCFSMECASYNTNHPIRYCKPCHQLRHNTRRGLDHVFHTALTSAWKMDLEMQSFLVEAVVSLLQDASPVPLLSETSGLTEGLQLLNVQSNVLEMHAQASGKSGSQECGTSSGPTSTALQELQEERLLLGRLGVWLLVSLCWPAVDTHPDTMARLFSMLCNWYSSTATNLGQLESAGEKLKTDYVAPWLASACNQSHHQILVSCLLPHPPECARVGGHWNTLTSRSAHLRSGLNRLLCLVPYEVVTPDIWLQVMPHWMEALVTDSHMSTGACSVAGTSQVKYLSGPVISETAAQINVLLSKLLDPEMSPLGFDSRTMYKFLTLRFSKTSASVQKQTLTWVQFLTSLDIMIQLNILLAMFGEGVRTMKVNRAEDVARYMRKPSNLDKLTTLQDVGARKTSISPVVDDDSGNTSPLSEDEGHPSYLTNTEFQTDSELNLSCCIMMLDILLKQMQLQNMEKHSGIWSALAADICKLLREMMVSPWVTSHRCDEKRGEECIFCESRVIWHQMALNLVSFIAPQELQLQPDADMEVLSSEDADKGKKSSPESERKNEMRPSDVVITMPFPEAHTVGNVLVNMPQIMTATVETVSEQLDLAPIIPSEKVVPAVARAVTLTETDVATATVQVQKATLVGENDQPIDVDHRGAEHREFWETTVGKFWFSFEELPQQLQYCHQILKELPTTTEPDVLYHMLQTLHLLILHGDAFTRAAKDHRGFLIWCQENLLIENLWRLLSAEHGHICEVCVPVLLHCVTLPSGLEVFWNVIQSTFHHHDWRQRFTAVERVTVIARFLDSTPLRNQQQLQSALANAFCYLISSMDDTNVQVAQRATLFLGTIHDRAIKALISCLETQFDSVIVDRPMVLQSLYQLHNSMSDRHILTWDFFLNRFDTLFIEAQINVEKLGDLTYLRDLRNSELKSEAFLRKLNRAHEALQSQSDTSNSGTASLAGATQASLASPTASAPMIKSLSSSFGTKWPYKRTMSAPASILPRADKSGAVCNTADKEKVYNRQYSAPVLKRRSSGRFLDGHGVEEQLQQLQVAGGGGGSFGLAVLHRIVEFEECDSETVHLLVFLLMQFMSRPDQAFPSDDKSIAKAQNIVLRHLYLLLGYNLSDRAFHISSQRLRCSAVFRVFLANLPQLLDHNHVLGLLMLPTVLTMLIFCPAPVHHTAPFVSNHELAVMPASYSLWLLEPLGRRNWLTAVLVVLYKYQFTQTPFSSQVQLLVRIVLNTLDSQHHMCRRIPGTLVMGSLPCRSRDISQPSLGASGIDTGLEIACESPAVALQHTPLSPMYPMPPPALGSIDHNIARPTRFTHKNMETHWEEDVVVHSSADGQHLSYKHAPQSSFSIEADETESELAAIPESPQSGSTLHQSLHGSFEELACCQMVEEQRDVRVLMVEPLMATAVVSRAHLVLGSDKATDDAGQFTVKEEMVGQAKVVTNDPPIMSKPGKIQQQQSVRHEEFYFGSPDSPLSKMELHSIVSPVYTQEFENVGNLEIPNQERLLPIGSMGVSHESIPTLVESLKLNLGLQEVSGEERGRDGLLARTSSQDSADKRENPAVVAVSSIESASSPRKLQKQPALVESPPSLASTPHLAHVTQADVHSSAFYRAVIQERKPASRSDDRHRCRQRKGGLFTIGQQPAIEHSFKPVGSWYPPASHPAVAVDGSAQQGSTNEAREVPYRTAEECVLERCSECGLIIEEYSDEEIGYCIIVLGTFIHAEPMLAAPLLPEILRIVSKISQNATYCWQSESKTHLPAGAISVAHQFLRCVLHQLAPNGVFTQIFQTQVPESIRTQFFKSVAQALMDFNELNPIAPLQLLLEGLSSKKTLPLDAVPNMAYNMSCYLECLQPFESGFGPSSQTWNLLLTQFETFFRRIALALPALDNIDSLFCIIVSVLKIPGMSGYKGMLEPFSKVMSYAIQNFPLRYQQVSDLSYLGTRAFVRERERLLLTRTVVLEFVQALKFKSNIPDLNFVLLTNFILQDSGGSLVLSSGLEKVLAGGEASQELLLGVQPTGNNQSTSASECMRQYIPDIIEFIMDVHTLSRVKSNCKGMNVGLNNDTLGGLLKSGLAQYLAIEITRGNSRDNRAVSRYLPWLCNVPSVIQQGPREFLECMSHIRLLSWLLLGSLNHTALVGSGNSHGAASSSAQGSTSQNQNIACQPIPQEASCHIADHIQVILAGFVEQSKASVLHMSSLFHAFILCQLWTVYLEQHPNNTLSNLEAHSITMTILFDFWGKVTPCILTLVSHSKVLAEMVNLHFLSLLEALLESNSMVLSKLLPLWCPVIYTHQQQLPGNLQVRLQMCRNLAPEVTGGDEEDSLQSQQTNTNGTQSPSNVPGDNKKNKSSINQINLHKSAANPFLLKWLQRLQFKMSQIELQSSAAAQFYAV